MVQGCYEGPAGQQRLLLEHFFHAAYDRTNRGAIVYDAVLAAKFKSTTPGIGISANGQSSKFSHIKQYRTYLITMEVANLPIRVTNDDVLKHLMKYVDYRLQYHTPKSNPESPLRSAIYALDFRGRIATGIRFHALREVAGLKQYINRSAYRLPSRPARPEAARGFSGTEIDSSRW